MISRHHPRHPLIPVCLTARCRCEPVRGGRLPVPLLAATVVGASGAAAGESPRAKGGPEDSGEAEEGLLSPAAGPPAAAPVEGAEQGPGQALRHHTG